VSNQVVSTPIEFLQAVEARFGTISFDLAANYENNVVRRLQTIDGERSRNYYFGPGSLLHVNSFMKQWSGLGDLAWLNPPFEDIEPWAERCHLQCALHRQRIALQLPAAVCTNYFIENINPYAYVLEVTPRVYKTEVRDVCLAMFEPSGYKGREVWRWK